MHKCFHNHQSHIACDRSRSRFHIRSLKKLLRLQAARQNKGKTKWEAVALPQCRSATYAMLANYQFEHEKVLQRKADTAKFAARGFLETLNLNKVCKCDRLKSAYLCSSIDQG